MESKLMLAEPQRTFVAIFETGDDVTGELKALAKREKIQSAHFTAVGGFMQARLGFFDWETKDYVGIPVDEQVEVLSMDGDIALKGDEPEVHAHAVVGRRDGTTRGGHVLEATVRPTLEVVITDTPGRLRRVHDERSGLALIDLDASSASAAASGNGAVRR